MSSWFGDDDGNGFGSSSGHWDNSWSSGGDGWGSSSSHWDNSWSSGGGGGGWGSSSSHWNTSWSSGGGNSDPGYGHTTHTRLNWGQRPFVNHGHAPHNFFSSNYGWGSSTASLPRTSSFAFDNSSIWGGQSKGVFGTNAWDEAFKKK